MDLDHEDAREDNSTGQIRAAISNRIVGLHKRFHGRGPTKARTFYSDDIVVCVLEGGFSRLEETLIEHGRGHAVAEQRDQLHDVLGDDFRAAVEELTGRRVIAFMTATHQSPEMACEIFVLGEPVEGGKAQYHSEG